MYIGKEYKRDIELDNLKVSARNLRPNRSWLDLFILSLSNRFNRYRFDFTTLTDNLSEDEVIIIDSHDDIFKGYQIHFWRKDIISDFLPAIKCPYFKSENMIFNIFEMYKIREFICDQNHAKSILIENTGEELSINLVYGNTVKISPSSSRTTQHSWFLNKPQKRYKLWKIGDCACKPKKIRVQADDFENLKHIIDKLERISNITDAKLGVHIKI